MTWPHCYLPIHCKKPSGPLELSSKEEIMALSYFFLNKKFNLRRQSLTVAPLPSLQSRAVNLSGFSLHPSTVLCVLYAVPLTPRRSPNTQTAQYPFYRRVMSQRGNTCRHPTWLELGLLSTQPMSFPSLPHWLSLCPLHLSMRVT